MEIFTYFAYGSNMLTAWLKARCPGAEAFGIAQAHDYRLAFVKESKADGSGKATLLRVPGSVVHGALFRIPMNERPKLDRAEGQDYQRDDNFVVAVTDMKVTTYLAVSSAINNSLKPYDWYRDLVRAGAKQHGLPTEYQNQLATVAADLDPDATRKSRQKAISYLEAAGMR
ncbi:MAG: gamma-glutamylcyclotransferase family protein [Rhizomicrobium sp.]